MTSNISIVILHINIGSIGILFPIHKYPSFTIMSTYLTQAMLLGLLQKCDTFNMFIKPDCANLSTHCYGSNLVTPLSRQCTCFKYLSSVNYEYLFLSLKSYSMNINCGIFLRVSPVNRIDSDNKCVKGNTSHHLTLLLVLHLVFLVGYMVVQVMEMLHHPFPFTLALLLLHHISHVRGSQQISCPVSSSFSPLWMFSIVAISTTCMMMLLQAYQLMMHQMFLP